jgi:hypothetical protein
MAQLTPAGVLIRLCVTRRRSGSKADIRTPYSDVRLVPVRTLNLVLAIKLTLM